MRKHLVIISSSVAFALCAFALPVAASAATIQISIHDDYYTPQSVTINPGDTVVWTNNGSMQHTVTSDSGLFNSATLNPGGTFSYTFTSTGTYGYHCQFHGSPGSGMYGTIIVSSGSQTTTTQSTAGGVNVSLGNLSISPSTVDINAGQTVVWTNTSSVNQTVMANNESFQSGSIAPGGEFAATFNNTGTYNYYDNAQGSAILGEVVVGGTSVATTPPPTNYVNPNANYQGINSTTANSSPSVASLTSEVQSLIAEINAIEGTSGTGSSAPVSTGVGGGNDVGSCPQIGRVLSPGSTGGDVTSLQKYLAQDSAIYPQGLITGFYGSLTEQAVENWQAKYHIVSSGSPSTNGFGQVGPRTAAAMAIVCGGGSYNGVSSSAGAGTGVVGGFLQVTPITGNAPLIVNVTATVNTAGSCSGATYNLDFGDGSQDQQIPVAAGNCSQANQQFQHTYQYGGTYTVTLSAQGHSSTATVSIAGPAAPQSGSAVSTAAQATGSMSALVTSGNAPLTTTFYVSCASGLAYDVVFGDGTDLGGSGVSQSSCSGGLEAVAHTYETAGTYTANLVIFTQNSNGTVTPQTVASQSVTAIGTSTTNTPPSSSPTSYAQPTLAPNYGSNPLAVQLQFSALACGSPYSINWGDSSGTQQGPNTTCASGQAGQTSTYSPTYTYAATGSYTITLTRTVLTGGSQTSTVAVAISE